MRNVRSVTEDAPADVGSTIGCLWEILRYPWTWVPAGVASLIAGSWWLLCLSIQIRVATGFWFICWIAFYSPLEAVVIIAYILKFKERNKKKKSQPFFEPKKTAFEATIEANM